VIYQAHSLSLLSYIILHTIDIYIQSDIDYSVHFTKGQSKRTKIGLKQYMCLFINSEKCFHVQVLVMLG